MAYLKVIKTGHIIEVYEYERAPFKADLEIKKPDSEIPDWIKNLESSNKTKDEYTRSNSVRCRNMIRRLALANFNKDSKFITLTFNTHITCLDAANTLFKQFVQRLRYRYGKFKYIAVIEFMKSGRIHYHMMSDLPYIKNKVLAEIWENGFVKINNITKVDNVGAYMVKYMIKDIGDNRLAGRKAYLCSKNLDRPEEYKNDLAVQILMKNGVHKKEKVFTNSYISEYLGEVVYTEYNLERNNSVNPIISPIAAE
jgi:hypothetical protein